MRDDLFAGGDGLLFAAEFAQDIGGVGVGGDEAGIERRRPPVGLQCFAEPLLILESVAEIGMSLREIRLQSDRPLGGLDRLPGAPKSAVNGAEVGQRFDIIGFDGDRAGDQIGGGFMIAAMMRDQSEMMQAEAMVRLGGERLRIDLFRRAMASRPETFERQHQGVVDRRDWPYLQRALPRRVAVALQCRHRPSPPRSSRAQDLRRQACPRHIATCGAAERKPKTAG